MTSAILGTGVLITSIYGIQHILRFRGRAKEIVFKEKNTEKIIIGIIAKTVVPLVWDIRVFNEEEDGYQWYALSFQMRQKRAYEKAIASIKEFASDKIEKNEL